MSFDKDKKSALKAGGYTQSSADPDKWINKSNNHWAKSTGGGYIVSTDHHTEYGSGQSNSDFKKRI